LTQTQLPEWARGVLEVGAEEFKRLARRLARVELYAKHDARKNRLAYFTIIALGRIRLGWRRYDVEAEVPYCREKYGDSRGVLYAYMTDTLIYFGYYCIALYTVTSINAVLIRDGEATTSPHELYELYEFLYKKMGTGARPLLDLAIKAEAEGDREVAGVLRKLYAVIETSGDIIREIEQADYSGAKEGLEEEVERKTREAVELLKRAKELARKGDTEGLRKLLETVVFELPVIFEPPRYDAITLGDIVHYLRTREGKIKYLLSAYHPRPYISLLVDALREEDIYDVIITAAEHFGLEVRRR